MMSERQIKERIFMLASELRILEEVLNCKVSDKMGRPLGSYKYSDEQIKFLTERKNMQMKELIKEFNKKFETSFSDDSRALYNFMERSGIKLPKFRREAPPRVPTAIDKSSKTRERKMLEDLKIMEKEDE